MTMATSPAEQVLRDLGISAPEDIDVEAIAWHMGAKVKYRSLNSCEARIVGHNNMAIITVDDRKSAERQRFSVGHELGHWHHHRGSCLICRSDEIGNALRGPGDPERVADGYAADILLPRFIFDPFLKSFRKLNVGVLRQIKTAFSVSLTAASLRVIDSNVFPAILVCHGQGGRRWFRSSRVIPDRWFPRDDLDADSYAFDMLFGGAKEQSHPRKIGADAWFDRGGAGKFEILEQSFALPNHEIATLLIIEDEDMLEESDARRR